jgi:hypothetical protein
VPLFHFVAHVRPLLRVRAHRHFHGRLAGLLKDHAMKLEVIFCDEHFRVHHRASPLIRVANLKPKTVFTVDRFLADNGHFDGAFLLVSFGFIDSAISNYGLKNIGNRRLLEEFHAHLCAGNGSDQQAKSCGYQENVQSLHCGAPLLSSAAELAEFSTVE